MKKAAILLCCAVLCVASSAAKTVALTVSPRIVGHSVIIEGVTDLPDQAVIEWELRHEQLFKRQDIPVGKMCNEGHAVVHGHRYRVAVDLTGWPSGSIEVWVAFQPLSYGTRQPAQINSVYGRSGEWIEGDNVSIHPAHMKRVEVVEHVRLGR